MPTWNNVKVGSFLTERKDRFKPDEANKLGLKRLYKIDFSGKIHLLDDKQTNTGMILVKKGDLVISGINVEKGAISVYQGDEDVLATIHYSSYNFDKSQIDIDYFKWFLKSQTFKEVMQSQVRGGIKTELKPKHFLPLKIDLPDLPTQKAIRDKINNVSNEIREVNGLNIKNEDYVTKLRQSILQEAVSGKLVPQDSKDEPASVLLEKIKAEKEELIKEKKIRKEKPLPKIEEEEIPFEIPKNWIWTRLAEVCNTISAGGDKPKDFTKNRSDENKVPVIANGVTNKGIIGYTKDAKVFERSITVSGRGTIGYSCIREEQYCPIVRLLVLIPNSKVNFKFLDFAFLSMLETGLGTSIPQLTVPMIKPKLIPLPPLNEQKRIVEKVDQLMKLCDELEEKVKENQNNADLLMEAVLREAFEVKESG